MTSFGMGKKPISNHMHHHHEATADVRRLSYALAVILAFLIFEVVLGIIGHSLALLSDAGHMLADAVALGSSVWAARLAAHPARGSWTFGLKRAEILSAQANGITLLALSGVVGFVAIQRLVHPLAVTAPIVIVVAIVGIGVNLAAAALLRESAQGSLNVEGSYRHVVTDLFAFIATLIAGVVIFATGFERADAIASLLVVALMLYAAYGLLRESGRILLEGGPAGFDIAAMATDLASQPSVVEVHDVHVWTITSGFPALAAHVLVEEGADCHAIRHELERVLKDRYNITHTTLQVDHAVDRVISPASLLRSRVLVKHPPH